MTTVTLKISTKQAGTIRQALECQFDMANDMLLDDLFVQEGEAITKQQAGDIRKDLSEKVDALLELQRTIIALKLAETE